MTLVQHQCNIFGDRISFGFLDKDSDEEVGDQVANCCHFYRHKVIRFVENTGHGKGCHPISEGGQG